MKRLFKNTIFTSIDYFVLIVLNLLATPVLIKNFGVDGYGAFVFLSIFSIYGALSFFDLGMEGSLMNYVARFEANDDTEKLQNTLSAALVYYAAIGFVLGTAIYFAGGFIADRLLHDNVALSRESVMTAVSIIAFNIFLQFVTVPFSAVLQGMRRFVITKSINSGMTTFRYILIMIAAVYYHKIEYAFAIITGLTMIQLFTYLYYFSRRLDRFKGMKVRFDFALLKTLFNYSSILFVNRIIGLICNQIDKILIWLYMVVANMTIYDVVSRPANLLRLVLSVLNSAIVPEVARMHQLNDIPAIRILFINMIRYSYLLILPVLAILGVYINDLLRAWVGDSFVPHSHLALILLAVYIVLPIPSVASTFVVGLEKVRQTIWIAIVSTAINITLSVSLLHVMGLAGLLTATFCAELFGLIPYLLAMRKFLDFEVYRLIKPLLPIALVNVFFLILHVLQRWMFGGHIFVYVIVGACIVAVNYLANYRYLLGNDEKTFLWGRVAALKAKFAGAE
ncbi:MAG: oligosaccharide flippase family protein [Candidatus Zixiibacteriota bacterium]